MINIFDIHYLMRLMTIALTRFIALECVLLMLALARRLSLEDASIPRDKRYRLFAYRASRIA